MPHDNPTGEWGCQLQIIPHKDAPKEAVRLDIQGPKTEVSSAGDAFLRQEVAGISNPKMISTLIAPYADTVETVASIATVPYTIKMQCGPATSGEPPSAPTTPRPPRNEEKIASSRLP